MTGSLYVPGDTWLHRASPAGKLLVLALGAASLMWVHSALWLTVAGAIVCGLLRWSGVRLPVIWSQVRVLAWLLFVLSAFTCWSQGLAQALELIGRVTTLVLGALVVSITTSLTQMMAVVETLLRPLERLGWVRADKVALTVGLTLRLIPELGVQWQDIKEAQLARGLSPSPLSMAVPMLIRTIQRAEEISEAIDARG